MGKRLKIKMAVDDNKKKMQLSECEIDGDFVKIPEAAATLSLPGGQVREGKNNAEK